MIVFILLTIFPIIVALTIRGRYYIWAIVLSSLNILSILGVNWYIRNLESTNNCGPYAQSFVCQDLENKKAIYFITINILITVIAWYLAFKKRNSIDYSKNTLTAKQLNNSATKTQIKTKVLNATGWIIVVFVVMSVISLFLFIGGFGT